MKINIIDSPTGSGKTTYLINMVNQDDEMIELGNKTVYKNKYIFVTPFLTEIERICQKCKDRRFVQPSNKNKDGTKLSNLKWLVQHNKNIATTHALFALADEEFIILLKSNNYTLILDEVMDVISPFAYKIKNSDDIMTASGMKTITEYDKKILLEQNLIEIDRENGNVLWVEDDYSGQFNEIKTACLNEALFCIDNCFFMWSLPVKIFEAFSKVYISTFMFDAQIQRYYYDYFSLKYEYFHIEKKNNIYVKVKTIDHEYEQEFKRKAKKLITILDNDRMNAIGDYSRGSRGLNKTALSKSWYMKNSRLISKLKTNTLNFYGRYLPKNKKNIIWTTFKPYRNKIKGKGYTKGFVPCNSRATNDYMKASSCAYLINRYLNPYFKRFFQYRNIEVDEDKFALSELIQWLWRSRLRKDKTVILYIPSRRMRDLLKDYLNS